MKQKQKQKQNKQPPKGQKGQKGTGKNPISGYHRGPFGWLIIGLVVMSVLMLLGRLDQIEKLQSYSQFKKYVKDGYVQSVVLHPAKVAGKFSDKYFRENEQAGEAFEVNYDREFVKDNLEELLDAEGVDYGYAKQDFLGPLLWNLFPLLLLGGLIYFIFIRNARAGGGMLMSFGRSRHKLQDKNQEVTFDDVAGIEEAKDEVAEAIEFLKNPEKFKKIGGRIPRGVLLIGPPGCGKTLLAKAISGESDVPFFSISGSDFVEMFVGVGASRVRDLFKQAKENSPCIIFLDEIDAIGRKRGPGFVSGGHDEREQTLNAILVEMDGFDTDDQVIVIAATNRSDILDHALTRPGRFDRQVVVPLPDIKGRIAILQIHARKVKIGPDANFERMARGTPMFSGAELEALINEAAISASMANKDHIEMADLEEARDKVRWGRAKKSRVVDEEDKKITAYHEAGHAFVQSLLKEADPLHKVSIIPRGPFGGATFALPEKDRVHYTRKYCQAQLQVCFGGRIAEEIFCDDITSGAQADIQQATVMAKEMILTWGMGEELGPINYSGDPSREYYFPNGSSNHSEKTAELIDKEIRTLIDTAYAAAKELIEANKDKLDAIAQALIKYETLDAEEVKIILDGGELDKPTVSGLLALEQEKSNNSKNNEAADTTDSNPDQSKQDNPAEPPPIPEEEPATEDQQ